MIDMLPNQFLVERVSCGNMMERMEAQMEVEKTSSADSSFSEAIDEDQLIDEGLDQDSFNEDSNEIMILEDLE